MWNLIRLPSLTDDPGAELQFGERGTVDAKDESPRGEASIEAYGRADELLRQDRQKEPESAINMYIGAEIGRGSLPERRSRADEQLREYREGKQTLLRGSAGLYRALPERRLGRIRRPSA